MRQYHVLSEYHTRKPLEVTTNSSNLGSSPQSDQILKQLLDVWSMEEREEVHPSNFDYFFNYTHVDQKEALEQGFPLTNQQNHATNSFTCVGASQKLRCTPSRWF
jgi:hypothetical protein